MEKRNYPALFIIGFIILYFLIGMVTGFLRGKEIFPFFSWSLFSNIPNKTNEYTIIVDVYNGMIVSPPQLFQEAKEIIRQFDSRNISPPASIIAYYLMQDFGKAYERGEIQKAEKLRRLFEANYIKAPARYRLVRLIYNPVERWKTGKYEMINIQEFSVGRNTL